MATQIYVNLPVSNLQRSNDFFTKLGFKFNPQFSDEKATCMIINENAFVMLLEKSFFKTFIKTEISDAFRQTEALMAISAESKEGVDKMLETALAEGGKEARPANNQGFMYDRSFHDPDGHIWEVIYMDVSAFEKMQKENAAV